MVCLSLPLFLLVTKSHKPNTQRRQQPQCLFQIYCTLKQILNVIGVCHMSSACHCSVSPSPPPYAEDGSQPRLQRGCDLSAYFDRVCGLPFIIKVSSSLCGSSLRVGGFYLCIHSAQRVPGALLSYAGTRRARLAVSYSIGKCLS